MGLNLNKQLVTKQELLKHVSPLNIYNFYSGRELKPGKVNLSPLRNENNPSFALFYKDNELFFKDFVVGGGDCIKFVQKMFGLNFMDALSKIVIDFDLKYYFTYNDINNVTVNKNFKEIDESKIDKNNNKTYLNIKMRRWQQHDLNYWNAYGITLKILKFYKVVPISHIFLNENIIVADKYAYAYIENKDNELTFKIYQPFNKKIKWLTTHDESIWQGWNQLPEAGYNLIVTKSLKDIMAITSVAGMSSTALQNENIEPKESVISEIKNRFENIFLLYDNDFNSDTNWGREFGKKLSKVMDIKQIEIPTKYKAKDFSDFVKKYGIKNGKKLIKKLTNE